MSYIISYEKLEKLAKGELKVEDLAIPENIALSTWSGEDVRGLIEQKKLNIAFEDCLVNEVTHRIGHCSCGECVQFAFDVIFILSIIFSSPLKIQWEYEC